MLTNGTLVGILVIAAVLVFAAAMEWILGSFNDNDIQE